MTYAEDIELETEDGKKNKEKWKRRYDSEQETFLKIVHGNIIELQAKGLYTYASLHENKVQQLERTLAKVKGAKMVGQLLLFGRIFSFSFYWDL